MIGDPSEDDQEEPGEHREDDNAVREDEPAAA